MSDVFVILCGNFGPVVLVQAGIILRHQSNHG